MKVSHSLIIALFLGNTEAVTVQRLLNPLQYAIANQKTSSLAQTGSNTKKFMSIGNTLDNESSFENSHTSRLDDFLSDAHQTTMNQIKQGDNQKYDSKAAIQDSLKGDAGLTSAVEQSKNSIQQASSQAA